jgi:hypothetical protein
MKSTPACAATVLQLLDRRGPVHVARDDDDFLALLVLQHPRELADRCRLAGSLQPRHQDHRRRLHREVQGSHSTRPSAARARDAPARPSACPGERLPITSWPSAFLLTAAMKSFTDRQGDVGLEQRDAHFAQRVLDVRSVRRASPRICLTIFARPCGQVVEHG